MDRQPLHWSKGAGMGPGLSHLLAAPANRPPGWSQSRKTLVVAVRLLCLAIIAGVAVMLVACARGTASTSTLISQADSSSAHPQMSLYKDPQFGYSFEYPKSWQEFPYQSVSASTVAPDAAVAFRDPAGSTYGTTPADFMVMAAVKAQGQTAQSMVPYLTSTLEQKVALWKTQTPDLKTDEPVAEVKVNGLAGVSTTLSYTAQGSPTRVQICVLFSGDMTYQFVLSADGQNWQKDKQLFDATMNSFQLKTEK